MLLFFNFFKKGSGQSRKRGSYFFVIDAFIASLIIIMALTYFFKTYFEEPESLQEVTISNDLLSFLESNPVKKLDLDVLYSLRSEGVINGDDLLSEAIAKTYYLSHNARNNQEKEHYREELEVLIKELTQLVPKQKGFSFSIITNDYKDVIVEEKTVNAKNGVSAYRIVTTTFNNNIVGPYLLEFKVWY